MTKIRVDLPDAEKETIDPLVTSALSTTVSAEYPSSTLTGSATHLQVDREATETSRYPVAVGAQVRVTAHAAPGKRTVVTELASDAHDYLCSLAGGANVAGFFSISGASAVSTDPATRNVMCWVLVRVDLLASLAS